MTAIQFLTIAQTTPQRGQAGAIHPSGDASETGDADLFATLLTRTMTDDSSTTGAGDTRMIPLNPDGSPVDPDAAGEGPDRLALTLSATEEGAADTLVDGATVVEGGGQTAAIAAPTVTNQQLHAQATGQTGQGVPTQAASQAAAAAAAAASGNAAASGGVHGTPAATAGVP